NIIAIFFKVSQQTGGIGTEVRLREPEAAHYFTRCHLRQEATFLFVAAKSINRMHHQRSLYGRGGAYAAVPALQLLHHQAVSNIVEPAAARFKGNGRPEAAQRAEALQDVGGEDRPLAVVVNDRGDLAFYPLPHCFTD